jgi:hypothetical protein
VKAGDGAATHAALQAWVDEQVGGAGGAGGTEKKAAGKSKKPAKRSKATA